MEDPMCKLCIIKTYDIHQHLANLTLVKNGMHLMRFKELVDLNKKLASMFNSMWK